MRTQVGFSTQSGRTRRANPPLPVVSCRTSPMDAGLQCICGRQFPRESALTNHRRTCKKAKTRLGSALLAANDAGWTTVRKRPRLAEHPEDNLKMTIGPTAAEPEPNHQPTTLSGPNDTCPILPFDSVGSLQLSDRNAKDLEITMTTVRKHSITCGSYNFQGLSFCRRPGQIRQQYHQHPVPQI